MDDGRKDELALAVNRLLAHNLWRRGKMESEPVAPKELGDAIDTVCGAAIEHLSGLIELDITKKSLRSCEKALDDARAENRRLHAILAGHGIHFKKKP